jgi:2-oxoglutarate ferredoxin oxidoreductase subunit gamma
MIVLGGYLKVKPLVELKNVILGLKKSLPDRYHHMIPDNEKAIMRGLEIVEPVHTLN